MRRRRLRRTRAVEAETGIVKLVLVEAAMLCFLTLFFGTLSFLYRLPEYRISERTNRYEMPS
jgi:hypothetical protein